MSVNDLISVVIDDKNCFRTSRSMKLNAGDDQPNGTISQSELFQNVERHRIEGIFNKLDLWILQVDVQQDHHPSQINTQFALKAIYWCNSTAFSTGFDQIRVPKEVQMQLTRQPQQQAWSLLWQIHLVVVSRVSHASLGHEPKHCSCSSH